MLFDNQKLSMSVCCPALPNEVHASSLLRRLMTCETGVAADMTRLSMPESRADVRVCVRERDSTCTITLFNIHPTALHTAKSRDENRKRQRNVGDEYSRTPSTSSATASNYTPRGQISKLFL
ncbi:hypothetical protein NP493_681g01029 [Ridgeia piscesae]|uniref:Uncharacterized protein n=1 Tax=Ridgeia piscesae TaxID=27915 RepID=A0AAD9KR41_RIDPI|nr:hypothetical protein NP493_681g01029 [Ridgeia piscesae]